MTDQPASTEAGTESAAPQAAPEAPESFTSASEAARYLASVAHAKRKSSAAPAEQNTSEAPETATADESEAGEKPADDATPQTEANGEVEAGDPAETPLIERPKSWSKEKADLWTKLDNDTKQYLLEYDSDLSKIVRNAQNESAEQRKALEAKAQETDQRRQQYEAQLPLVTQAIHQALLAEFPDIKTDADVQRLANEDWPRYIQWDLKTKQLARWQNEMQQAQVRQQQEATATLQKWVQSQDDEIERILSSVPESERTNLANEAKQALIDYGMKEDEIVSLWNTSILRSAPIQRMMADAARYRIAKRGASKPAVKAAPPVQKPGNAIKAPNRALDAQIAALDSKPSLTINEAMQLMTLKGQRRAAA